MSKRGYITRYLLILKRLKAKPYSSLEELQSFVHNQLEYMKEMDEHLEVGLSQRTFSRDLAEIRNHFGVDIVYSKKERGYYINKGDMDTLNFERRLEAFDTFNALNLSHEASSFIHLENRKAQGMDNIYGLIHAIKNRVTINFQYQSYWYEEPTQRTGDPLALKEFKNRWYVFIREQKNKKIKTFGLERLTELEISTTKFDYPTDFNVARDYKDCFGIIRPNEGAPEEIILSFKPHDGKYIKSMPLHESQEILVDNETECRVKIKLYITYEFVVELVSYADNMRVIAPESLIEDIKAKHEKAFQQYL